MKPWILANDEGRAIKLSADAFGLGLDDDAPLPKVSSDDDPPRFGIGATFLKWAESPLQQEVVRELAELADSLRAADGPRSVLHVLMLEDNLSLGEIAGVMHVDPRDIELKLLLLVDAGWVVRDLSYRDPRFSVRRSASK